jgi:hypothetical protein
MESQLPEANFVGGHVSLLSGIGIQIDNIQSSQVYAITSDLPQLFVYSSKESVPEPEKDGLQTKRYICMLGER